MRKSTIIYQADQSVAGKHLKSKGWVMYSGRLTIYDRKINPIVLQLKSEIGDSLLAEFMEDKKLFHGESVSDVYGKVAKWYFNNGIILQS